MDVKAWSKAVWQGVIYSFIINSVLWFIGNWCVLSKAAWLRDWFGSGVTQEQFAVGSYQLRLIGLAFTSVALTVAIVLHVAAKQKN